MKHTSFSKYDLETYENLSSFKCEEHLYKKVPYHFVQKQHVLPLEEHQQHVIVATADPLNINAIDDLAFIFQKPIKTILCKKEIILDNINKLYHQQKGTTSKLIEKLSNAQQSQTSKIHDLLDNAEEAPIIKLINSIITEATQQNASDIHLEPYEKGLKIRYRIDGVLQTRHSPPQEYQNQLITRIKVMAHLDIAERRLPQDGRIKLRMGKKEIDFRVSTIPIIHGERIVLRILDKGNIVLGLENLGMPSAILTSFKQQIQRPEGIILVTGPTGSGKTTTLYSSICDIKNDATNIMTIEDPVEYNLQDIAQIGVLPKIDLTFAKGLKHILRQDPDVIMIGEIRDSETAKIAVQAALTGHLVLSTLHTNDAPSAITRLIDMGIEPFLLSSTIIGVLAQRLIRKICPHCKQQNPCEQCYNTGYKGRHGIYELLQVNDKIKNAIIKNPDATNIRTLALQGGMQGLIEHGKQLVTQGITTTKEVLRITQGI